MNFTKKFTLAEVKLQKKVFQSFQLSFITKFQAQLSITEQLSKFTVMENFRTRFLKITNRMIGIIT